MKRSSRKRPARKKAEPTKNQIRQHIEHLLDAHQIEWHNELLTAPAPEWTHLLCLHIRMVELAKIEAGMQEFF